MPRPDWTRRIAAAVALILATLLAAAQPAVAQEPKPDAEFSGILQAADAGGRRTFAFEAPKGAAQVRVAAEYERAGGTTLTLGVYDPERFRGWGGAKSSFIVGETFASPSFNPGPIPAGGWRLVMNVAHVRAGQPVAYHIRVYFARAGDLAAVAFQPEPLENTPGWYRGDLHAHTGHSDGVCRSLAGKRAPCPVFFTLQAAVDAGLDFLAVTDHNATSQFETLAEMQPYFDTLLLLPGREMTTAQGHFNLIGPTGFVEADSGAPGVGGVDAVLKAASATGGFVSLNHPSRPTGADCLGCGWSVPDTDYRFVDGIEAINGGNIADVRDRPDAEQAGVRMHIGFWQSLLDKGYRLTGVGGSDNHDAIQGRGGSPIGAQSPVGHPTTVVYAQALSQPAILAGLKSGRVFVDLGTGRGRLLDLSARIGKATAVMGGSLSLPARGAALSGQVHVAGAAGNHVVVLLDGRPRPLANAAVTQADQTLSFDLWLDGKARWLRADVEDAQGRLVMLGNPIYLQGAGPR